MTQEGTRSGRAQFIGILKAHLKDGGFCSDTESLLRYGISCDPQAAGNYVITKLLRRLPEELAHHASTLDFASRQCFHHLPLLFRGDIAP
jgi:hypothetical protein